MASFMEHSAVQLKFRLKEFETNLKYFQDETDEACKKVVMAGAAAWATTAQRHTPPSLGQQDIAPSFYTAVEMDYVPEKGHRSGGMRMVFNLRKAIKNPQTHRWKKMFGQWLREGYEYAVVIKSKARKRKGRWMYIKPLHTGSLVNRYDREDYRGLMRLGWGLGFLAPTGKMPPVFKKYLQRRPVIQRLQGYCGVTLHMDNVSVIANNGFNEQTQSYVTATVRNGFVDETQGFVAGLRISSDIAALKAMSREMEAHLKKKWNL